MDKNDEEPGTDAAPDTETGPAAREGTPGRIPGGPVLTGDPRVDAVLAGLDRVPDLPVAEHAALYAGLHDGLLAALNEEPPGIKGSPVPGPGAG
ncbi:hypothetical protein H9638_13885 [Arthrobacter sp. Sa2BUA2]|uniref:Uncharacterized protein n=1 Tax=Arthrobacter pullicola TaxID=2762224 RepID=A0ABR8YKX8_9MICC|nr:hypothetical protein [Arthrobacter pullicola]MBD8044897.1 hypothetical protein [Arthrobacter pullicola]